MNNAEIAEKRFCDIRALIAEHHLDLQADIFRIIVCDGCGAQVNAGEVDPFTLARWKLGTEPPDYCPECAKKHA